MIITGVGSRESPFEILTQAKYLGIWVQQNKYKGRSGGAGGFDSYFAGGALDYCDVFLPFPGFNGHGSRYMPGNLIVVEETEALNDLVRKHHPRPDRLKPKAWALMRRNGCQVLGLNLDEPTDAVVCWAPGDKGGTGQAIRIAEGHGIPVIRMHLPEFSTAKLVVAELERIRERKNREILN